MTVTPLLVTALAFGPPTTEKSSAAKPSRVVTHLLDSAHQSAPTTVQVLTPTHLEAGRRYPVLYVLPVEAGTGTRWGDAMAEVEELRLPDRHDVIVVYPTFAQLPWYADHPTEAGVRQETHFLDVVVPFVEKEYPAIGERKGRFLLGFSKSGWGAFSLLLRHPERFERAAAWDAPLTMQEPGRYGSGPIFGTAKNFAEYRLSTLLEKRAKSLGDEPRLFHSGYDNFRESHLDFERLLLEHRVPHAFTDGPRRKHAWDSGWLDEAAAALLAPRIKKTQATSSNRAPSPR